MLIDVIIAIFGAPEKLQNCWEFDFLYIWILAYVNLHVDFCSYVIYLRGNKSWWFQYQLCSAMKNNLRFRTMNIKFIHNSYSFLFTEVCCWRRWGVLAGKISKNSNYDKNPRKLRKQLLIETVSNSCSFKIKVYFITFIYFFLVFVAPMKIRKNT